MPGRAGDEAGRVDLHTHTVFSDGQLTPEALVELAIERRLVAIAITDHDAIDGIARARAAAAGRIEIVPGIEVSTSQDSLDLHILGFFIDPSDSALGARLRRFRRERIDRVRAIVERLETLGVSIDVETVYANAGPGVVGRPHVATALIAGGHVKTVDDAFKRYLGARAEAFVPRPAFHPAEAIAMISDAGGVSVLAHPGAFVPDGLVRELVQAGLDGVEVWHPQHGPTLVKRYRALAAELELIESGGSDYHGPGRHTDLGGMRVPGTVLRRLKDAAGVPG
jgi:predicted metal-dependent phosphoesterase TrpH